MNFNTNECSGNANHSSFNVSLPYQHLKKILLFWNHQIASFLSILAPEFLCAVGNSIPRHCLHLWCLRIWRIPIRIIYSLCFHQHSFDFSRPNNLFSTLKAKVGFFYYHHFQQIHSYFILYISHLILLTYHTYHKFCDTLWLDN